MKRNKILIGMMVCDSDKDIAISTIDQLLRIFKHDEIGILIIDDSVNHDAATMIVASARNAFDGDIFVHINTKNFGFFRLPENLLQMLEIFMSKTGYEFLVRIDPDMFPSSYRLSSLFEEFDLPRNAIYGVKFKLRKRDYIQLYFDLLPFGFTRKYVGSSINQRKIRPWRMSPTWWAGIFYRSKHKIPSREIISGSLMIFPRQVVEVLTNANVFSIPKENKAGLIFGDDYIISSIAAFLGVELSSIDVEPYSFKANIFISNSAIPSDQSLKELDLIHPLKNNSIGKRIRDVVTLKNIA